MTPKEMETIIDKAGLFHTEAAFLFDKISRHTLQGWFNGVEPKNKSIFERAQRICCVLKKAVDQNKLPLPPGTPKKQRRPAILQIIHSCNNSAA